MPITDYATYKSLIDNTTAAYYYKQPVGDAGRLQSAWTAAPFAGTAPTTAVACSSSTTGAITFEKLGLIDAPTKTRRIGVLSAYQVNSNTVNTGTLVLIDRLSHQGGIVANVTGAQTTNLPTAALTRYTSGEGVFAALEIYTQIGATAATVQISYTNQAGTPGRTSPVFQIGGTGYRSVGSKIIAPLQDGDTGVQSVENVNFISTTGTGGNVGVTLFKPLDWVTRSDAPLFNPTNNAGFDSFRGGGGLCPVIEDSACLEMCALSNGTTTPIMMGIKIIEDDA